MLQKRNKTVQRIVDVARQLFAEHGRDNVTMNDIAQAAGRGRRTLYAYFQSKDDVYRAVIRQETEMLYNAVRSVTERDLDPSSMLSELISTHLGAVVNAVRRNGSLRSDFFKDIYEVERARRKTDQLEIELIRQILEQGIRTGEFRPLAPDVFSVIIFYAVKGVEVPYIKKYMRSKTEVRGRGKSIINVIFSGIKTHPV
ncbi:MAG: TetR/AcrR family transcriptional regulator [Paludibacteraceae bacterium]|nr:TetR/AcrR family transcriptional regulator [Paludibacteraceae bacterium]